MSNEIVAALIGVVGVVVGGLVTTVGASLAARGRLRRELDAAALLCLARLEKIRQARAHSQAQVEQDERWHLGSDLNRYVASIAAAGPSPDRELHWNTYVSMVPLALGAKFGDDKLDDVILRLGQALERLRGRVSVLGWR